MAATALRSIYLPDITAKILKAGQSQTVLFCPPIKLNATRFLSINDRPASERGSADYEFYELTRTGSNGAFGRHPDSTDTSGPINIWYVDTIEALNGFYSVWTRLGRCQWRHY